MDIREEKTRVRAKAREKVRVKIVVAMHNRELSLPNGMLDVRQGNVASIGSQAYVIAQRAPVPLVMTVAERASRAVATLTGEPNQKVQDAAVAAEALAIKTIKVKVKEKSQGLVTRINV